jgi:hypothetical protein
MGEKWLSTLYSGDRDPMIVIFNGTFNPVLAHAIGISCDTERYISSGGPVPVLDRRSESFKGQIR